MKPQFDIEKGTLGKIGDSWKFGLRREPRQWSLKEMQDPHSFHPDILPTRGSTHLTHNNNTTLDITTINNPLDSSRLITTDQRSRADSLRKRRSMHNRAMSVGEASTDDRFTLIASERDRKYRGGVPKVPHKTARQSLDQMLGYRTHQPGLERRGQLIPLGEGVRRGNVAGRATVGGTGLEVLRPRRRYSIGSSGVDVFGGATPLLVKGDDGLRSRRQTLVNTNGLRPVSSSGLKQKGKL